MSSYPVKEGNLDALNANPASHPFHGIDPGYKAQYIQKCIDSITGLWTYWKTGYRDINGNEYPGPGFNVTYYKIVGIVYLEG